MFLFADRPKVQYAIQWTGANFSEVEAFAQSHLGASATDNQDGTVTLARYDGSVTGSVGKIFYLYLDQMLTAQTEVDFYNRFQNLNGDGPFAYDITDEV